MLAGDLLAGAYDTGQASIPQREAMLPAALAPILENDLGARELDMAVAHRGEPIAAVLAGVLPVADPNEGDLEEMDHGRQNLLARQPTARLVFGDAGAKLRQRPGEREHAIELG